MLLIMSVAGPPKWIECDERGLASLPIFLEPSNDTAVQRRTEGSAATDPFVRCNGGLGGALLVDTSLALRA